MKLIGFEPGHLYLMVLPEGTSQPTIQRVTQSFHDATNAIDNPPFFLITAGDFELTNVRELPEETRQRILTLLQDVPPAVLGVDEPPSYVWDVWYPVKSSNIDAVRYNGTEQALFVRFHTQAVYRYAFVPESVFLAFMAAESKGQFFAREIKGRHSFTKLETMPTDQPVEAPV